MTPVSPSSVSAPQPRAQHRSIALWLVAACSALPAVTTAQTSADIISAVTASRANIARLEVAPPLPFVCAPPAAVQCATPAPKDEFETTAAFTARLAAAEQACNEGRRQAAQTCRDSALARDAEIKTDEHARAAMREQRMVLPVWNATALYDADREAFLVAISDARGIVTLGKSLDDALPATATELTGNISRVCAVTVLPRDAPEWRAQTSLFLEFRLDALSPPRISDAVLLSGIFSNKPMTRNRLAGCLGAMPTGFAASAKALANPMERPSNEKVARAAAAAIKAKRAAAFACQDDARKGAGCVMPVVLRQIDPNYTLEAMRAKIQGSVLLECIVDNDGSIASCEVVRSLDNRYGLDLEAIKTARQWRFRPGMRNGAPVPFVVEIEMLFELR